jgi:hypothetical protein
LLAVVCTPKTRSLLVNNLDRAAPGSAYSQTRLPCQAPLGQGAQIRHRTLICPTHIHAALQRNPLAIIVIHTPSWPDDPRNSQCHLQIHAIRRTHRPMGRRPLCIKIGDKMFASIGSMGGAVAVKCATVQDALHLEDMFGWPRHRIFTARWCLCPWIRARQSCAIALKSRTLSSAPR